MNTINTTSSKLFAAALSTILTTVVTASILFGMAGFPGQGQNVGQPLAAGVSVPQHHA